MKKDLSPPVKVFYTGHSKAVHLFSVSFLLIMFGVCNAFLSVHCSLMVYCWERADLLALLYVMLYCVFVTFPCGVLGQVWGKLTSFHQIWLNEV